MYFFGVSVGLKSPRLLVSAPCHFILVCCTGSIVGAAVRQNYSAGEGRLYVYNLYMYL